MGEVKGKADAVTLFDGAHFVFAVGEEGGVLKLLEAIGVAEVDADLFAIDLDEKTLIQYVDRILMFYIRTADRLQRTSVWLENLEGGLEYLKQVVIEDKLNVAADLEEEMAANIGKYQCEWKTTIESPEKLKRFQHFINSGEADDNLKFVTQRQQRFPTNGRGSNSEHKPSAEHKPNTDLEKRIDVVEV